ncbi:MAG: pro-sigmaK processing inhibitor BofA family protein [Oscillospiraceae bacterium]|nr:pro-sigmaK processing inhibitor BofA family protein [Oscillospiraceae bacterium]
MDYSFFAPYMGTTLLIGIVVLIFVLLRPIRRIFKFLIHAAIGFIMLFVFNYFGAEFGMVLELDLLNCLVTGFLGIPGLLGLIVYHFLL